MSDKMRWRYGDTNPVVAAVDAETVIHIGDLVFQEVDDGWPASANDLGAAEFKRKFLGVAMQRSHAGDTTPFRVGTTGVFEFDAPKGDYELGDLVAVYGRENQRVLKTDDRNEAIGRVARRCRAASSILVDIRSTVMTGGV